jgi:hypothetical protein
MDLLDLAHALAVWPRPEEFPEINPGISREHLFMAELRTAYPLAPSIYPRYFDKPVVKQQKPAGPSRSSALVIRPGSTLPVSLNGHQTTANVDSARRINHAGKYTHLKLTLIVNTEKLPLTLQNETKCACLYCGTEPRGNDFTCRSCGAALPDC